MGANSAETARTVLVVDDEPDIRESLKDVLVDEGYQVMLAGNGREALALLPTAPRPLVVIMDIIMPVMNGTELYAAMQADAELRDIPVVISTSDPSRTPSGVPLMKKPINLGRLLAVIAALF
jgi:two-component system, sensor histidine kinase and response regulator